MNEFKIGKTLLGARHPCFIIAEIGINFDGKLEQAIKLIDSAAEAGCNAAKFQLFSTERMYPPRAGLYTTASGKKRDIYKIVKQGELPPQWIPRLIDYTRSKGLEFFATACDEISADILDQNDVDAYKIASFEITHIPLLRHVAKKGKPVIFSCGAATLEEVAQAREVFRKEANKEIALLHCVGQYPAELEHSNLAVIKTLTLAFPDVVIGYSDHTEDPTIAPEAAVALGAKIIEKHITLDRSLPGPDHSFAVDPKGLKKMVRAIRSIEKKLALKKSVPTHKKLLGSSERKVYKNEVVVRDFCYRTVFATRPLKKGDVLTTKNTAVLRPGHLPRGIEPRYWELLTEGAYCVSQSVGKHETIQWEDLLLIQ